MIVQPLGTPPPPPPKKKQKKNGSPSLSKKYTQIIDPQNKKTDKIMIYCITIKFQCFWFFCPYLCMNWHETLQFYKSSNLLSICIYKLELTYLISLNFDEIAKNRTSL